MATVPSGVICAHVGTNASIPAGWSRVTAFDARFVKQIATAATNPGATGGSASHNHTSAAHGHSFPTHTHGWAATGAGGNSGAAQSGGATNHDRFKSPNHTHSTVDDGSSAIATNADGPTTWSTASVEPPHLVVIFIKSDGTPTGLPANALAYFNGAAPTGWTTFASAANRLLKGAAAGGDGGGTGGTGDAHNHSMAHDHAYTQATHSHGLSWGTHDNATNQTSNSGPALVASSAGHSHASGTSGTAAHPASVTSTTATTDNGDATPPWKKILPIQNTSGGVSLPLNIICLWDGTLATIPAGWQLCDGSAPPAPATTTPNLSEGKYVRGAVSSAEVGNIGGTATHPHTGGAHTHPSGDAEHTHTGVSPGVITNTVSIANEGAGDAEYGHGNHASPGTSPSATIPATNSTSPTVDAPSNDPVFTAVAYIQLISLPPLAPTIETPVIGATYSGILTLAATTTDPEGHNWRSEWEYSADGGTNWSSVPGDGSTVASGSQSRLDWDTATVSPGINYKVRVWGIDSVGVEGDKTTLGGTFIIGPSLSAIFAANNTPRFFADADTAGYVAENNAAIYFAEKN